ncbi:enoyl-CoA hydratase [Streptomyces filamentosus]|uniref:enoyl-CoA hydratase n=1 Tax=Streptomyces filamentosus TaxID=67294 RepID=UPI0037D45E24
MSAARTTAQGPRTGPGNAGTEGSGDGSSGKGISGNEGSEDGTSGTGVSGTGGSEPVRYERRGPVAVVTMDRPRYRNAQNSAMTYALDRAFYRAAADDEVKVVVLAGAGEHFSAGHDIGTPERDAHLPFERRAGLWWDHSDKAGAESRFARESEVYLGMCRRWRELPKPVVASVQGACVAGGLMLAWICDLIVASEDAFFADPVVRMGIPGVEYFAHPWVMPPRIAKEFLYTGDRMSARRAHEVGMVNHVVPREELTDRTMELANRIAAMPRMGLALAKRAVNQAEDLQGLHTGMDAVFGLHHLAHAHNAETARDPLGGMDVHAMKAAES